MRRKGRGMLDGLRAASLRGETTARTPSRAPAVSTPIATNEDLDIFQDTTASSIAPIGTTSFMPQAINEEPVAAPVAAPQEQPMSVSEWAASFNKAREANKNAIGTDVLAEEGRYYRGTQGGAQLGLGGADYKKTWNEGADFVANNISEFIYQDKNGKLVLDTKGTDIDLVLAGLAKFDPELPNKLIKDQDFKLQDKDKGIYHVVNSRNFVDTIGDVAPMLLLSAVGVPALASALGTSTATAGALLNAGVSAAQGGDIGDIAKNAALSYVGGNIGDRIATGLEFGVNPFGEQAGMLSAQTGGMTGAAGFLPTTAGGTVEELIKGKNLEEAVLGGLGKGVKEIDLDTKNNLGFDITISTPEFLRDFDKAVIQPAGDALADFDKAVLQPVTKPIAEAAQYVDDEYIDPFVSTVKEEIFDPIQEVGREFDRGVLQPTKDVIADTGQTVYEDVIKPTGQFIDDNIIDPIDQAIRDIEGPDVDLPDIDLPDVDWKGLFGALLAGANGMFSGGGGTGVAQSPQQDAIQTELLDYKPFTPYRSKLSPNARLLG